MFRTKAEILSGLDHRDPASIRALLDFHHAQFGGWLMGDQGADKGAGDDGKDVDGKAEADKPLGPNGEKALQAERDARQRLETELKQFKADQADQAKKLAEALGIKTGDDAKPSTDDVVAALQAQIAGMQRENLVFRIVTDPKHPVTDPDDVKLIADAADEAAMRRLAARLTKPADPLESRRQQRFPRQDGSQGQGGGNEQRPTSVREVMEERAAARAKRSA